MRKFKVGDRVTYEKFGTGTVIDVDGSSMPYLVEFDKAREEFHNGNGRGKEFHCFWCYETDLVLGNFTKTDLQEGDKLTLRNGSVGYYSSDMNIDDLKEKHIEKDLTNNGYAGSELDIVKVERPSSYVTVYEREKNGVKEMTVEEISKELGYEVKIVKGD